MPTESREERPERLAEIGVGTHGYSKEHEDPQEADGEQEIPADDGV